MFSVRVGFVPFIDKADMVHQLPRTVVLTERVGCGAQHREAQLSRRDVELEEVFVEMAEVIREIEQADLHLGFPRSSPGVFFLFAGGF